MVYNVRKYGGNVIASVPDNQIDTTSTSISLIGRNAVNFGLPMNENFVAIMQNFAGINSPPNPIQGQTWFDTTTSSLKVWQGSRWLVISPPFDGNAGTATVVISTTIEIVVLLSNSLIIAATSHTNISPSLLPSNVTIGDKKYDMRARFPNGIAAGITLATDANGYKFAGTSTTANALAQGRTIELSGSLSGNVIFDGSSNVILTGNLISVLNSNVDTSQMWTKFQVASNGTVTNATTISDTDIFAALGYTPPSTVRISGDANGNAAAFGTVFNVAVTISNTTVTPGTYNKVTVGADGRVTVGANDTPVPVKGIILYDDIEIPTGWAICNGQTVSTPTGSITTPNLSSLWAPFAAISSNIRYIMRVFY